MDYIKSLALQIEGARVENLEDIAISLRGTSADRFAKAFALTIVGKKLEKSAANGTIKSFHDSNPLFPFLITASGLYAVEVTGQRLVDNDKGTEIKYYAEKIRQRLAQISVSEKVAGFIQCMPYQINNGNTLQQKLIGEFSRKEIKTGFVNLPYDQNGLDRRINLYSDKVYH